MEKQFDTQILFSGMNGKYNIEDPDIQKLGLSGYIKNIKVDFFNHGHGWLEPPLITNNIRMASLREIAAMKLYAIAGNGTRLKDFVHIAYLGSYLTTDQMLHAYKEKYKTDSVLVPLRFMFYYGDINFEQSVELINTKFKWKDFEKQLDNMQRHTDKIFPMSAFI